MPTIQDLQDSLNNKLNDLKTTLGTGSLTTSQVDLVSAQVDSINETWNENLPPRPH